MNESNEPRIKQNRDYYIRNSPARYVQQEKAAVRTTRQTEKKEEWKRIGILMRETGLSYGQLVAKGMI
ncbi:MAG: hypothetical protein PHO41_08200 [Eubacteriales bacterium]|nr:hypothetical protein [Eubacteriales bacterium]